MPESLAPSWCVPGGRVVVYPRIPRAGFAAFVSRVAGVGERSVLVGSPCGSYLVWFPLEGALEVALTHDHGWAIWCLAAVDSPEGRAACAASRISGVNR